MKTKHELRLSVIVIIMLLFVSTTFCLKAQTSAVIERKIGKTVYLQDTTSRRIENKANSISKKKYPARKDFGIVLNKDLPEEWRSIFRKVFSKERAEELKNVGLVVNVYVDSIGDIKEVVFLSKNFDKIELSELQELEQYFKSHQCKVSGSSNGQKYFEYGVPCQFGKLYKKE